MSGDLPPAVGDFPVGALVSSYRLDQIVARGGMAVVYRATDTRLDRTVALKVLAPELARDESFRQRFLRESRSGAAVDHPNVIPVYEAGEDDGVLYIAMRYVTGSDVRELVDREGPLPAARAVSIVTQVASALDAAHAHGLIHRDVKPANMLLAEPSDGTIKRDHVYLSDFGLSKQSISTSHLTGTGQFLGTIDYMSPEQIEGRPVDGRTDLYALACAAFEMLTGQPPFRRDVNLAVMWAQVAASPPSVRDRRPECSPQVDQVLAKALAKSPEDRQATCMEFATTFRAACAIRPAAAGQPGAGHQPTELASARGNLTPPVPAAAALGPEATVTDMPAVADRRTGAVPGRPAGPAGHPGVAGVAGVAAPTARLLPGATGYPPQPTGFQGPPPRRRGRALPVLIGLLVLAILAGAAFAVLRLRNHGLGGPVTTITRTTSPTSPPVSATSTPPPSAAPADVVRAFYTAINNQDYRTAWNLDQSVHSSESYGQFKSGYSTTTASTALTVVSVSGDVVQIKLTANQLDGTIKYYAGTYTVQNGAITGSNIQQVGGP